MRSWYHPHIAAGNKGQLSIDNGMKIPAEVTFLSFTAAARKVGNIQSFIEALQPAGFLSDINGS